jgi:hypothetical protein
MSNFLIADWFGGARYALISRSASSISVPEAARPGCHAACPLLQSRQSRIGARKIRMRAFWRVVNGKGWLDMARHLFSVPGCQPGSDELSFALLEACWTTPAVPDGCASVCLMPALSAVSGSKGSWSGAAKALAASGRNFLGRWASAWLERCV